MHKLILNIKTLIMKDHFPEGQAMWGVGEEDLRDESQDQMTGWVEEMTG